MVHAYQLYVGDKHSWVECQVTTSLKSSGWLFTNKSLEAQGYFQGNHKIWLPMPQFIAYKVPSKERTSRRTSQIGRTGTQKSKQK